MRTLIAWCLALALYPPLLAQDISGAEYFFDADPGPGFGVALVVPSGSSSSSQPSIDASALASGFHSLNVRYRTDEGVWGIALGRPLYIHSVGDGNATPAAPITAAEYFFDTDPGPGLGVELAVADGNNTSSTHAIDLGSLAPGFHILGIRYRNQLGAWSLADARTFFIFDTASGGGGTPAEPIEAAEYFFDTDPGPGLGLPLTVPAGNTTSALVAIDVSALPLGLHNFNIRYRDANGVWGIAVGHLFQVAPVGHPPAPSLARAEYFFDTDPGPGQGEPLTITPGDAIAEQVVANVTDLPMGAHIIGFRLRDDAGAWGLASTSTFTVTAPLPPPNDDCANAMALTLHPPASCPASAMNAMTLGASGAGGITCTSGTPTDVWFTVASDLATSIGVSFDPRTAMGMGLRVLDACNGNVVFCANGNNHVFPSAPATSYVLQVFTTTAGTFSVCTYDATNVEDCLGVAGGSAVTGTPCDDGSALTLSDSFDEACDCVGYDCNGTPGGTSGPGTPCLVATGPSGIHFFGTLNSTCECMWTDCNAIANGPYHPGRACDDLNANTPTSYLNAECACVPYDCQGTPNGPYMVGAACAVGSYPAGAISPHITADCNCSWTDCLGITNGTTLPGTPCNDGNSATENDAYGSNCQCAGVILDCLGVVNGTAIPGTACTIGAETGSWSAGCTCVIPRPDPAVSNVSATPTTIVPGDSVEVSWMVTNIGAAPMPNNWMERVRVRSSDGLNLTFLGQRTYSTVGSIASTGSVVRTMRVLVPTQFNVGDQCVFVVEVSPGAGITEVSGGAANNTAIQAAPWSVAKLLYLQPATAQMTEGGPAFALALRRTGATTNALVVTIGNTNVTRIDVPTNTTIPAGQYQQTILVQAPNNVLVDGAAQGTISVSAADLSGANTTMTVLDDEQPTLSFVGFPASTMEGNTYTFQVTTNLAPTSPLAVTLSSTNSTRFPLPSSVMIPQGSTSASITVNLVQDVAPELNITVTAQAGAAGHIPANVATLVADDDVPGLELVIAADTITETGGSQAAQAILRRSAGSSPIAFTATISASLANTLILPPSISLAAGQQEVLFNIGVVDNALNDGFRNVTITAALTIPSCGCGAPPTSAGYVANSLVVVDNDGPSITVTPTPLTLAEGQSPAGQLRIQRNTSTASALVVALSSSDINETTAPATATIPIGSAFVDVPITTINDGVSDGSKIVYFNASAAGFAPGVAWAMVTDVNKPDLRITERSVTATIIPVLGGLGYTVTVTNSGFATAPSGTVVRGYLSLNNTVDADGVVMIEHVINTSIPAGSTTTVEGVAIVPDLPGDRNLLFVVNPLATISELLHTNNNALPIALNIRPAYSVVASVAQDHYLRGQPVPITGSATRLDGSPAANVAVEVYVISSLGLRREVMATTNAGGTFNASFVPLTNEVGHLTAGAAFPNINATEEQDAFDILGVRLNNGAMPNFLFVFGDTLTGNMPIRNLCSLGIPQVTIAPVNLPSGAVITFGTIPVLAANANTTIPYTITGTAATPGSNYQQAELKVTSSLGDIQPCYIQYFCQTPQGHISASPANITTTVSNSMGQRLVEVLVVNNGAGPTGDVSISLPQVPWLNTLTPVSMPSILPGDSALVILRFLAHTSIPFNYAATGTIGVNTSNGNDISIPFSFTKVSESSGEVVVEVENQFTYFAAGQPMVEGALVKIKNFYTGVLYAEGLTDADGRFVATNVPEGTHRITVEKDQHITHSGEIAINPGASVLRRIFLVYQAVTFSWTVVPTEIEDSYTVTLTTNFQTNVPIPVVTIDGPDSVPHVEPDEPFLFNLTLENHGLVTAENVRLLLPTNHPVYEFVTNYQPAPLPALSSITVPVSMRVRQDPFVPEEGGITSVEEISEFLGMEVAAYDPFRDAAVVCQEVWRTEYEYTCSEETGFLERTGNMFRYSEQDCDEGPDYGDGGLVGWSLGDIQYGGAWECAVCGTDITGATNENTGPGGAITNTADCRLCKEGLISAVGGVLTDCAEDYIEGKLEELMEEDDDDEAAEKRENLQEAFDFGHCVGSAYSDDGDLGDYLECVPLPIPPIPPVAECAIKVASAALDCAFSSFAIATGRMQQEERGGGGAVSIPEPNPYFLQMHKDLERIMAALLAEQQWANHYYGALGELDAWDDLFPLLEPNLFAETPFSIAEQQAISAAMAGYELDPALLQAFFDRWNLTREAWALEIYSPTVEYPNIIDRDSVIAWSDSIEVVIAYADTRGFETIGGLFASVFDAIRDIITSPQTDAVCASVTVQFSQQVTMTREAFTGTLVIANGHPTHMMDSLSVDILITDVDDVPSNGLFQVNTLSVGTLGDVTGTGQLDAQFEAAAVFQFIPTIAAAPTVPKQYRFGGSMTYWDPYAQAMTTLPFTPITLTVNPGPNLMLHYFLERDILGDDALTEHVVEPSVPAELAVMVRNDGYGPAQNMIISSAQPEIVDNENGLAVDFQLIGSNLQGQPANLGVTNIHFGTVPASDTRVGQWYMTSSLLGHFSDYDAQVVHNNSFGNPELSLIQGAELHELTHSIRAYGAYDDGISDFLVNAIFDPFDRPEIIYFSQGDSTAIVRAAESASFSSLVGPPTFTNTLTLTPDQAGWNYIKLNDPGAGKYTIVSVTRQDGQVIPLNNAWLTFVTLPVQQLPVYEHKFHFVDDLPGTSAMTYTVVWSPRDSEELQVDTISGAPIVTSSQQLLQLTIAFNKPVDASTFTYQDLSLHLDQGPDLITVPLSISPVNDSTFVVDLSDLTTANGSFTFVVDATEVQDIYSLDGAGQDTVTWTQYHSVPAVQAFLGIPDPALATSYSTMHVRFNLPIDITSVGIEDFLLLLAGDTVASALAIDSVSPDQRSFYLSGLDEMMLDDGMYSFVVDVANIRATTLAYGLAQQSIALVLDNSGPSVSSVSASSTGGLDAQHITFLDIHLSEPVTTLPLAALALARGAIPIPLNGIPVTMISATQWRLGNLGFSTYNEGAYQFTANASLLTDALGNTGTGSNGSAWSVVRTTTLTISDPGISPDMGYSASDQITASLSLNATFTLNEAAQVVRITQVSGGSEILLGQQSNVSAGNGSIPITLPVGGTNTLRITAVAINGISTSIQFNVFADLEPLTSTWNTLQGQVLTSSLDIAALTFSARTLYEEVLEDALSLLHDGVPVPTGSIAMTITDHTSLTITGLSEISSGTGTYHLRLDLGMLAKYSSGALGNTVQELLWTIVPEDQTVKLALKAKLEGPFDLATERMHDSLRVADLIPSADPYPVLGYVYPYSINATLTPSLRLVSGDNAIVDWVIVELRHRSDPSNLLHSQPALVQRDGDIVGTDGTWPLPIFAHEDAYYIAVQHRNHLGVMTAAAIELSATPQLVDLSAPGTLAYGTDARRLVGNSMLLWCGDVNSDGWVKYTGAENDRDPILQAIGGTVPTTVLTNSYDSEDVNMDGKVMYTGQNNDRDPILQVVGGTVPTNVRGAQLP